MTSEAAVVENLEDEEQEEVEEMDEIADKLGSFRELVAALEVEEVLR